jgi:hypothetical protein
VANTEVPASVDVSAAPVSFDADLEWSQADPFDQLINLEAPEQEAVRRMLTVAQEGSGRQQ